MSDKKAYLILENNMVFEGESFGAAGDVTGEIVFSTGMTGYLETLSDPSYYGQIILQTFPLIGNYGIIPDDFESGGVSARGYIVKYPCMSPSNFRSADVLDSFLKQNNIIGLHGIDTRALTRVIRDNGVMNGRITQAPPARKDQLQAAAYVIKDAVAAVSAKDTVKDINGKFNAALIDFGAKRGIAIALMERGVRISVFSHNASADDILKINPNGIMLTNGPGDPADPANAKSVDTIKKLISKDIPIFGICLGHQLLALAHGYKTKKLKFGHRGANQPVIERKTKRSYITSQNHGYAVIAEDSASFINVNDGTCEGLDYGKSFSVQFHPEARSGPHDTAFLFDRFIERMGGA